MAEAPENPITDLRRSALISPGEFAALVEDKSRDYYVSLDWSPEFYVLQASRGFIAVATTIAASRLEVLLPQLQFSYCILPLHVDEPAPWQSVTKRSANCSYRIMINHRFVNTLNRIKEYHGARSWLTTQYMHLMTRLHEMGPIGPSHFQLCSVEVYDNCDQLVAGEIGYIVGSVFTSLSGFCVRSRSESIGKLQIISLARLLRKCGFAFLNLGQPPTGTSMVYKRELGGVDISRKEFLELWDESISRDPCDRDQFVHGNVLIDQL